MQTFVSVVHVVTCVLLVLVVLIQSGKGAEISASFSGSSQTVFGSSGGANFFTRFTQTAAAVFFVTSLTLTVMGGQNRKSLFEGLPANPSQPSIPVKQDPADAKAPAVPPPAGAAAAPAAGALKAETAPQSPMTPAEKSQ
jgi:preprotein translocase subunit SecG